MAHTFSYFRAQGYLGKHQPSRIASGQNKETKETGNSISDAGGSGYEDRDDDVGLEGAKMGYARLPSPR